MTDASKPHSGLKDGGPWEWMENFIEFASFTESYNGERAEALEILRGLFEQLEAANKALETPRQYDVLLSDMKEQLEATQRALLAFFAEFDDPDDKVSFYAPTGDTEALMRAALNPAKERP